MSRISPAEFERATFTTAPETLAGARFSDCMFVGCDFQSTNFSGATFADCRFERCNLALADVTDTRFQSVKFKACKLVGIEFFKCERRFSTFELFEACMIRSCNFSELKLEKVSFAGSEVVECDFKNVDLRNANFKQTDLAETMFHAADLRKANFRGARNYAISPIANKLKEAQFELPEALSFLKFFELNIINT